jgi:hypothetical protein
VGLEKIKINLKNMTKEAKTKMEKEIEKLTEQFYFNYGKTKQREAFFAEALPEFAGNILKKDIDIDKEIVDFIGEYKKKQLGGFYTTYGWLHNWLFDFAAAMLGVDKLEIRSSCGV